MWTGLTVDSEADEPSRREHTQRPQTENNGSIKSSDLNREKTIEKP